MKAFIQGLTDILFPRVCRVCGSSLVKGEEVLCLECYDKLPRTQFHTQTFSELHKRLATPGIPIVKASGWFFYYRDNSYASLIRDAKYNGLYSLASWMGRRSASELLPTGFFDGIDLLLPVPMHPVKKLIRGYNQADVIARAISEVTSIPTGNHLYATGYHTTQTRKSAAERIAAAEGHFRAKAVAGGIDLAGLHLPIIDDVITTGATMLANCRALLDASPSSRISVLSMGVTRLR